MQLTSTKNPLLQEIRRAASLGRTTEYGLVVAEGPHLLEEALNGTWRVEQIFVTDEAQNRHADLLRRAKAEIVGVATRAFAGVATTEHSQGLLFTLRPRVWTAEELFRSPSLVVVLDGIQDPGNAGTILRSAEAFGASGVVLLKGCAHAANGKFLRASAGSVFRLPLVEGLAGNAWADMAARAGVVSYALHPGSRTMLANADFRQECALIVGSEGTGVSAGVLAAARPISIPTKMVESLNAAVSCSIALFEAARQRSGPDWPVAARSDRTTARIKPAASPIS